MTKWVTLTGPQGQKALVVLHEGQLTFSGDQDIIEVIKMYPISNVNRLSEDVRADDPENFLASLPFAYDNPMDVSASEIRLGPPPLQP